MRVREVGLADVLDACAGFDTLVREDRLRREAATELDEAVEGAVKREVRDRWAWGRRQSSSIISPLEAVTLASWAAKHEPATSAYEQHDFMTV